MFDSFSASSLISFLPMFWLRTFSKAFNDVLMILPILPTNVYSYILILSSET